MGVGLGANRTGGTIGMLEGTRAVLCLALATFVAVAGAASAETQTIRISRGYGITHLPMYVIEHEKLLEKHAKAAGLGDLTVTWRELDGGGNLNDAMIAGTLDIASVGIPAFLTLWSKAKGTPNEVVGVGAVCGVPFYLNTNNLQVASMKDIPAGDRIALPGIKVSLGAVVLQMMVAKEFGIDNYAKLDPMTFTMQHPDAFAALMSGTPGVTFHMASPPFAQIELKNDKIRAVANSRETLGDASLMTTYAPKRFTDANPKLVAAFIAALDEANAFIAADLNATAALYVEAAKVKAPVAEMREIIADKGNSFSATPSGTMQFADFMFRVGSIKTRPADWKDVYVSQLHGRPGS
jgi:NitT/TauT family transport system substrate-binding protein